jgi:hypothetical protein
MSNNWKDRLNVENFKREGVNTAYVTMGLLGAMFLDRLVQKGVDKWFPSASTYVGAIKAGVSVLTGFGLSVTADEKDSRMRLIGYGVSGAGVISGLRLIPQVDAFLSDTPPTTTPPPSTNGLLGLALGDFGKSDNIRQISTSDAEETELDLPDLGRTETAHNESHSESEPSEEYEEVFAEVI